MCSVVFIGKSGKQLFGLCSGVIFRRSHFRRMFIQKDCIPGDGIGMKQYCLEISGNASDLHTNDQILRAADFLFKPDRIAVDADTDFSMKRIGIVPISGQIDTFRSGEKHQWIFPVNKIGIGGKGKRIVFKESDRLIRFIKESETEDHGFTETDLRQVFTVPNRFRGTVRINKFQRSAVDGKRDPPADRTIDSTVRHNKLLSLSG